VKLSSAIFSEPWGTVFDSKGDLVVTNFNYGTIAKFLTKQLKVSGAPIPKISVTGSETTTIRSPSDRPHSVIACRHVRQIELCARHGQIIIELERNRGLEISDRRNE